MRRLTPGAAWGAVIAVCCLVVAVLVAMNQGTVIVSTGTYTVGAHAIPDAGRWRMPLGVVPFAEVSPVRAKPLPSR